MSYDLQIEDVSLSRRRLRFTVDGAHVKGEIDRAYNDLKNRVKLPGFRPGKVPRHVLEARFGRQIRGEVGARIIEQSYQNAASGLAVAGQPAVEERSEVSGGQPFTFTIAVDVRPEVAVKDYNGMVVRYPLAPLSDEMVDGAVQRELSRRARIEEVAEPRAVAEGDFVLAEVKLVRDGEVLADEPGTMLHTRGERYYPGVEKLALGLQKDETRTDTVTIGAGSALSHLAGATVEATVKVLSVQVHRVPDLSDESAADLGYEGGAEGMKAAVRMKLQEQLDEGARNQARISLLQALVKGNPVDVPKGMVDEQFQLLVEELRVRRTYSGQDPRSVRFSDAEIADLRERASFAAKASVLLAGVARQEGIEVTSADLDAKITEIAEARDQAVEAIRGYLEREGAMDMLNTRILEERTLDWLMEHADLTPVDPAELRDDRDSDGEADAAPVAAEEPAATEEPAESAPAADE